ncbi:MAG: hypothetical protein V7K14_29795 [Nostoc sp.]|uniref:hypothetical protein n=1 Tax=unclassified Nostoc TaxID=2593658 RepID=UPI0025F2983E|nr:hypothetical protein [Nostoc sp. NMS7]MBN3945783.1 hypothetical protein [Nostoc sp. NMS7]
MPVENPYILKTLLTNRLKQFWRIASRYEKLAVNYTAMLAIAPANVDASIVLWS